MAGKSPPLPYMPLWCDRHINSTRLLSFAQQGATINLQCHAWMRGPLPSDAATLMRLIGCTSEDYALVQPILDLQFVLAKDGWVNEALEAERAKSIGYRVRSSERTARGGEKTKLKWAADPEGMAASLAAKKAAALGRKKAASPEQTTPEPRATQGYSSLDPSSDQSQTTHTSERESGTEARKQAGLDIAIAEPEPPKQPAPVPVADVIKRVRKKVASMNGEEPKAKRQPWTKPPSEWTPEEWEEYATTH